MWLRSAEPSAWRTGMRCALPRRALFLDAVVQDTCPVCRATFFDQMEDMPRMITTCARISFFWYEVSRRKEARADPVLALRSPA